MARDVYPRRARQQLRQGSDTFAQPLHSAAPDVVTRPGIHTLAIKLSYWFG